jgi:hypothetical protein
MDTVKLIKTMFKALDTKDKTRQSIVGFIHCRNQDGLVTLTATNGSILLKTELNEAELIMLGVIPQREYFTIKPNEVFAEMMPYGNIPNRYDAVQNVIPTEYSKTECYISFDPKYLALAKEFLQITDNNKKLQLPVPHSYAPICELSGQLFKSKSTNSIALVMPLRHKED